MVKVILYGLAFILSYPWSTGLKQRMWNIQPRSMCYIDGATKLRRSGCCMKKYFYWVTLWILLPNPGVLIEALSGSQSWMHSLKLRHNKTYPLQVVHPTVLIVLPEHLRSTCLRNRQPLQGEWARVGKRLDSS
ncbi:hypothetical protein BDW62DRAFT_124379 [Aspergillus aurantiobrunneus]